MVNAKLIVVGGNTEENEIPLQLPVVVGRGVEVDLAVPDELVSRRHAEIFESDGRLFVRDLGSKNGTFVNNLRIVDREPLDPDQLLTLGTVTFRAIYSVNGQESGQENKSTNGIGGLPGENVGQAETIRIGKLATETQSLKNGSIRPVVNGAEPVSDLSKETVSLDEYVSQNRGDSVNRGDSLNRNDAVNPGGSSQREPVFMTASGIHTDGPIPPKCVPK